MTRRCLLLSGRHCVIGPNKPLHAPVNRGHSRLDNPEPQSPRRRYSTCLSFSPGLDACGKNQRRPDSDRAHAISPRQRLASAAGLRPWPPMSNRARRSPFIPVSRLAPQVEFSRTGSPLHPLRLILGRILSPGGAAGHAMLPQRAWRGAEHSTVICAIQIMSLTHGMAGRRGRRQHHHHPGP